jgi:hypothetical protein
MSEISLLNFNKQAFPKSITLIALTTGWKKESAKAQ